MKNRIIILLVLAMVCLNVCAQKEDRYVKAGEMYMFGVSYSVEDSAVYLTDIKPVANTWVDSSNGFLYARNEYSGQLADFIKLMEPKNYVSVVSYATNRKKLEKKYAKMRQKFQKDNFMVKYIAGNFNFDAIEYSAPENVSEEEMKKEAKPERPAGKPDGRRGGGPGGMGPGGMGPGGGAPSGMGMGGPGGMGGR